VLAQFRHQRRILKTDADLQGEILFARRETNDRPFNGTPPAYWISRIPKPTMFLPHIWGSALVASRISCAMVAQSSRVFSSGTLLMNLSTLCLVGFVFASAISSLL
jgi:hypothetical protein